MADFSHFKTIYFEECAELLSSAEENLLEIQAGNFSSERIHAVFRAIHSIKGGAGSFGFHGLIEFAHLFETVLDALRNNKLNLSQDMCEVLLRANDVLSDLIHVANVGTDQTPLQLYNVRAQLSEIVDGLNLSTAAVSSSKKEDAQVYQTHFEIDFKPKPHLMKFGNEPKFIFKELSSLVAPDCDDPIQIILKTDHLPAFFDMDITECYLAWIIHLKTRVNESRIREAFEFVEGDCDLTLKVIEKIALGQEDEKDSFEDDEGSLYKPNTALVVSSPKDNTQNVQSKDDVAHSIRVELDRIDRLVNTVGEMVIKQAMLLDQAQALDIDSSGTLSKGLQDLTHHMRDLQEYVMAIRAQPVKTVFTRMPRLVRELSLDLKKEIRLETVGENTEIDKTVIERLGEPLTHMIRNAIDHGIEDSKRRVELGKAPYGTIRLSAEHKSGRIVIEMSDDGGGINRSKVLQKAIEQGLVSPEANLSGEDIDNLIFLPGFSTAVEVTNISGRGVGMDVVKKSIQSLGGRIVIQSIEGKGCKFTLTLPLTLAVLDGMIVSCGSHLYIIPLINIIETLRPNRSQISNLVGCHDILNLRTNTIPLLYLHEIFNIPGAITDPCEAIVVIVEAEGGELLGLVVDELHKQQQVVIKSLEENYDPLPGVSAATILGNGNVSMILDITALRALGQQQNGTSHHSHNDVKDIKEQRRL